MRSSPLAAALLVMTVPSWAADVRMPDPTLSPAQVVEIQLAALQANDAPETDAGIAQTWAFAHPDNKRMTGPLPRFAQMIKGPLYQILLGHRSQKLPWAMISAVHSFATQPDLEGYAPLIEAFAREGARPA